MNEDTRIAVCCYAGDRALVDLHMPLYKLHGCPIVVLSPDDSRVDIPGVDNRWGGKRCYKGADSLDRQAEHLRLLLTFPEKYFLVHDADSISLARQIPRYLYERDCVWSNVYPDSDPKQLVGYPEGWPHVAFQPPYFLNRRTIERMLAVKNQIVPCPVMLYIDHYMLQLTMTAKLEWDTFREGMSGPIWDHAGAEAEAVDKARNGFIFFHSTKEKRTTDALVEARRYFEGLQT
jgi:hypothetical protein